VLAVAAEPAAATMPTGTNLAPTTPSTGCCFCPAFAGLMHLPAEPFRILNNPVEVAAVQLLLWVNALFILMKAQ
jgi:hypothetical protein